MNSLIGAYSTEAVITGDPLEVLQILKSLPSQEPSLNASRITVLLLFCLKWVSLLVDSTLESFKEGASGECSSMRVYDTKLSASYLAHYLVEKLKRRRLLEFLI